MGNIGPQRRRLELLSERASATTTPAAPPEHAVAEHAVAEHAVAEHAVAEHAVAEHAVAANTVAEHPRPPAAAR